MHETLTVLPGLTSPGTLGYYADESGAAARTRWRPSGSTSSSCCPRKLAIDVVYVRNRSPRYDVMLIVRTLAGVAGLQRLFRRVDGRGGGASRRILQEVST